MRKTEFFEQRKDDMKKQIAESEKAKKDKLESDNITITEELDELAIESNEYDISTCPISPASLPSLEDDDPWNQRMKEKNI